MAREFWSNDPVSETGFPMETEQERKQRALLSQALMLKEKGEHPDPTALDREIQRNRKITGVQLEADTGPDPWEKDPIVPTSVHEAPWEKDPKKASWWETIKAIPGTALGGAQKGIGGAVQALAESRVGGGYPVESIIAGQTGESVEEVERKIREGKKQTPVARAGAGIAESGMITEEAANPGELSYWQKAVLSGVSSAAQTAPGIIASVATRSPVPAVGAGAALAGGATYAEARSKGLEPERAGGHAAIDAAAEGLLELIPAKFMVEHAGGPVFKLIAGTLVREVPTEVATTAINQLNAMYSTRPDMTWEEYGQGLLDTIGSTMVSAPLSAGVAGGAARLTQRRPGQPPEEQGPQTPQGWLAPGEVGPRMQWQQDGAVNDPLTSPSFDEVTVELPSEAKVALKIEFDSIDPTTIDSKQLEDDRRVIEEYQKAKTAPAVPGAEMSWSALVAAPAGAADSTELGATRKQAGNADAYVNPNVGERLDRQFSFATDPDAVGKTPRQVLPTKGTYVLGQPSEERNADLLQNMMNTAEEWRKQWMPQSTIVISNEQLLSGSALGWHYSMGDKMHMIVPAVLRNLKDPSKFNVNTMAGAFYNFSHEFGHALIKDRFYEGMTPDVAVAVRNESQVSAISEATLSRVPQEVAAVLSEYNALRQRIVDGTMSAEEFVQVWLGPAKLGRKFLDELRIAPTAPAQDVGNAIARRAADNSKIDSQVTREEFLRKMQQDVFSLDEYLAEQMSRYAYAKNLDQTSPLGRFLKAGLESLRRFFTGLKSGGVVAPGTSFQEWLDGLPHVSRLAQEKKHIATGKQKGKVPVKKAAVPATKAPVKKAVKKVAKVQHQAQADTKADFNKKAKGMINLLLRDGTIEKDSGLHEEAIRLIENNDRDEFSDLIREVTGKTVKFEVDGQDERLVSKTEEWSKDRFRSRFFKAWFGDWENSPERASVVRVGGFEELEDGNMLVRGREAGPPLVTFMARYRLAPNQVYYASTLRGAHYAESVIGEAYRRAPSNDMVPVVLNIRNPYIVADTSFEAPSPEEMKAQGYDGIVYRNNFDGDLSFVVFDPEQIKVVDDRSAYNGLAGVHMELDIDQSTTTGKGAARLLQSLGSFLSSKGPLRRALRRAVHHPNKVLQIQQLAHIYPDLAELSFFNQTNTEYVRYGASRRAVADKLLQRWERMSKRNMQRANTALLKEAEEGKHWFELIKSTKPRNGQEIPWFEFRMTDLAQTKLRELGIDIEDPGGKEVAEHILEVKNSLLDALNEDEVILFELLAHRYANSPRVMQSAWRQARAQVHQLRQKPFFPQGRFGNMMLIIEEKKADGPGYEVVWKEAFESEAKWQEAYNRAVNKAGANQRVRKHYLTDQEYVLMSLPTDFLDLLGSELGLTPKQLETLESVARPVKNERLLNPFKQAQMGLKGYTSDAVRSYANFTWHHSNAQAKLLHGANFNNAITGMRQRQRALESSHQNDFAELARVTKVLRAMETAKDYIMSPPNEMQTARAVVSITYLGLNVKTALLNLWGLSLVWSDVMGKFGPVEGHKRMAQGFYWATRSIKPTNLNVRREGNYLPPDIQRGLDRAIEEGVLAQSYAYHLAGAANASNLSRMSAYGYLHKSMKYAVDLAMYAFRLTELGSRRVTFVVALQENLEKFPGEFDTAYKEAIRQTNLLQNDYSAGNRVPFMRGGTLGLGPVVPMATVFMSFAQHMAFHGYGGKELGDRRQLELALKDAVEAGKITQATADKYSPKWFEWGYGYTARLWLLFLIVAGYEGLPGMENILDIIEVIWRKIGKKPFRHELREMIQAMDEDPVLWSRGLGHDVAGFDISRSIGVGRIVPGTDVLGRSKDESAQELAGNLAFNLMGPTGNLIKFGLSVVGDDKAWGEKMQKLPGGLGNIWNAYYWSENGVRGPNDGLITAEVGPNGERKLRDLTAVEIAGKALGFNPTIVSENREIMWNQYDLKMYFQGKRQGLKEQYWDATRQKDPEALADVKKAISEFNASLPAEPQYKAMRILSGELARSVQTHRRMLRAEEKGQPSDKRSRGVYEDVRESYRRP